MVFLGQVSLKISVIVWNQLSALPLNVCLLKNLLVYQHVDYDSCRTQKNVTLPFLLQLHTYMLTVSVYLFAFYWMALSIALSIYCQIIAWWINTELESCKRKWLWPCLRYHPGIYLEELRCTTKDLSIVRLWAEVWTKDFEIGRKSADHSATVSRYSFKSI